MGALSNWETLVVVGAGAAGMAAAGQVRRLDPNKRVIVLDRAPVAPVGTCGLPYLLSGAVDDPARLVLPGDPTLDLRCSQDVLGFDWNSQRVLARCLESGRSYKLGYDKLILAPGGNVTGLARVAESTRLHRNVFVPRTLSEMIRLRAYLGHIRPQSALVVGGGYLGVEMAEVLAKCGLKVTLAERQSTLMNLGQGMHQQLLRLLNHHAIEVRLGEALEALVPNAGPQARLALNNRGEEVHFDIAILATGICPTHPLLKDSGLAHTAGGAVRVDSRGAASKANVWAAGDCVEIEHAVLGRPAHLPLARPAIRQGLAIAGTLLGSRESGESLKGLGTLGLRIFDQELAVTGLSKENADLEGRSCHSLELTVPTRASYYAGGGQLHLAVVAEKRGGRLLGAQALGQEGAIQAVNLLAQLIRRGESVDSLSEFETAYQPSVASIWDPLYLVKRLWAKEDLSLKGKLSIVEAIRS